MSERVGETDHSCCGCFTHNGLPCCNSGHPEVPPFCGVKGCRGRWGWPTREHTLCTLARVPNPPLRCRVLGHREPPYWGQLSDLAIDGCVPCVRCGANLLTPPEATTP